MASDPFFDPFSAAEAAAEEVIDAILAEGGQRLYETYIEKKSFSFASQSVSETLVAELRMCFVRYDQGPLGLRPEAEHELIEEVQQQQRGSVVGSSSSSAEPSGYPVSQVRSNPPVASGWGLEPEPTRCRIDTWARACVPIKKKFVRPKNAVDAPPPGPPSVQQGRAGRLKIPGAVASTGSSRSPSRTGPAGVTGPEEKSEVQRNTGKPQMIPLVDEQEEDEEETLLREMKEREAKRKRDEDGRLARKAAEEVEAAAKLAQVKDQMKNKQCTYDSAGNIIWIQPPPLHKLPVPNPSPNYVLKKGIIHDDDGGGKRDKTAKLQSSSRRFRDDKKDGFSDNFKKFVAQQPSMLEAMHLAPGVNLSERGAVKNGSEPVRQDGRLSRKEYEAMMQRGRVGTLDLGYPDAGDAEGETSKDKEKAEGVPTVSAPEEASATLPPLAGAGGGGSEDEREASKGAEPQPARTAGVARDPKERFKVVRGADRGAELLPKAPATPRPVQPPPMSARVQMKREALGYMLSAREKVPPSTGQSRFPGCQPQPPLGATMGHGLHARGPAGEDGEALYFPSSPGTAAGEAARVTPVPPATPKPPRPDGKVVSKNPELVKRLFRGVQD